MARWSRWVVAAWCLLAGALEAQATVTAALAGCGMDVRAALAGGIAGCLTNGVLHPLDTAKTLRQRSPARFSSVFSAMASTTRDHGVGALYRGAGPAAVGAFPSSALYFGGYEFVKRRLTVVARRMEARAGHSGQELQTRTRLAVHFLSAATGNAISSVVFVPKEFVKQQLQIAATAADETRLGALGVLSTTLRNKGLGAVYVGYGATLMRNIPSAALRFVTYEELKVRLGVTHAGAGSVLAGAVAGVVASGLMTPMDVVKTKLATGALSRELSILQCLRKVAATEGILGLYAGLQGRVIWSALFSAIGFGTFEFAKERLGAGQMQLNEQARPSMAER